MDAPSTTPSVQALLAEALAHLAHNRFAQAERLLDLVRARNPNDCDALYLYGQMRRVQNRFPEAEAFYAKALAFAPQRPDIHYHHGQLLALTGRKDEALEAYRRAIQLKPNFPQAHLDFGLALQAREDLAGAEAAYLEALQIQPGFFPAQQALSAVLILLGRAKEAEVIARDGLARARAAQQANPRTVAGFENNLAIALSEQGRHGEALASFDTVQKLAPNLPRVSYNRGNTLQSMGRLDEAQAAYREAIARDPGDVKAHASLNQLLYRLNDNGFLQSYDSAMLARRDNPFLPAEKARFLFLAGHYEASCEAYNRSLALAPESEAAREGLACALTRMGRYEAASHEFERILKASPTAVEARCSYAECLLRAGDAPKARHLAEEALAHAPHNQLARALLGTALRKLQDESERTWNDPETLVQVFDLDAPDGFTDMETFNRELERYLKTLHLDAREHIDQTSRRGTKTSGTLFAAGHDLVKRLKLRIDDAVAAYIARMPLDTGHALFGRRSQSFRYAGSWSTILSDGGFHTNHVHPKGWISSAYYVGLPEVIGGEGERQGWIKFAEPPFDAGFPDPIRRAVRPVPGRLVLFPSYMWHGTIAFRSNMPRTTIAFDVLPASQA